MCVVTNPLLLDISDIEDPLEINGLAMTEVN